MGVRLKRMPHRVFEGFHHSGLLTCMLASLDNATGLVFISFPSESRSLFLLSVLAFGWAGSVVRSLPGAVDPASSLLVSTLDCLGGNHSPALERHFGRMRRWLQHSRRRDGGRREILGINKGVSKAGFGRQNESKRPESVYVAKVLCVSSVTLLSHTCGGDTQTQLRRVHATAANVSFRCKEGKRSRRPSGGWMWVTRPERKGRWECDGQQLPLRPDRLPPVDESMPRVLEPLLIWGQWAGLASHFAWLSKNKTANEKRLARDRWPSIF